MLFHIFRHIKAQKGVRALEKLVCKRAAKLCLSHARASEEEKGRYRALGGTYPRPASSYRAAHCRYSSVLTDDLCLKRLLKRDQPIRLALKQRAAWNTRLLGNYLGDLVGRKLAQILGLAR